MKWFDKYLQNVRISKARKYIKNGSIVLDIGSDDGKLFEQIKEIKFGIGIDPNLNDNFETERYKLIKGFFPANCPDQYKFDVITMLAVLEHIPKSTQKTLPDSCDKILNTDGFIIITVPSKHVDYILTALKKIGLVDGMSLEEHYGFDASETKSIFPIDKFELVKHKKFQFGLNNLFVFRKK